MIKLPDLRLYLECALTCMLSWLCTCSSIFFVAWTWVLHTVMLPAWRRYLCCVFLFCCQQWAAFEKLLYLPCTFGACPSPMVIYLTQWPSSYCLTPHKWLPLWTIIACSHIKPTTLTLTQTGCSVSLIPVLSCYPLRGLTVVVVFL